MKALNNWIWLDNVKYGEYQKSFFTIMCKGANRASKFAIAEFRRRYIFDKKIARVKLKISADTCYQLTLNGDFIGTGPACCGGDFLSLSDPFRHYSDNYELELCGNVLEFHVRVQHVPDALTDYSKGQSGLAAEAVVIFEDGSSDYISTDESWESRIDTHFKAINRYDASGCEAEWSRSVFVPDIWHVTDAPIEVRCHEIVYPSGGKVKLCIPAGEEREIDLEFDKIHSAYAVAHCVGNASVELMISERDGDPYESEFIECCGEFTYRAIRFKSFGHLKLKVKNRGTDTFEISPCCCEVYYPIHAEGSFTCSDTELNDVYDVCKWTLRICRQSIHLDSPKHQELLACTGDYYIESLMTAYTFGDMALAEFDVKRTADWLEINRGVMYHTSYSLIWVQMLYDVYMYTGNRELLYYSLRGLKALLERFGTYLGENGLLEYAPNYIFVDWTTLDGYNMHHPPKYLGQSVLTAFYYGALRTAEKIYAEVGDEAECRKVHEIAQFVRDGFNKYLYDEDEGLYFEGLGTPERSPLNVESLPPNEDKRYFAPYSNILAVNFGICDGDRARRIAESVASDTRFDDIQPYFMHFELEALDKTGLFEKYGIEKLCRWKELVRECNKGLKEGWFAPPYYRFDHSHAWGGTPAYQLPQKLLGLKIIEPGLRKITLSPSLYGLESANIEVPTPFGFIRCSMKQGMHPEITVPDGIEYTII